MRLIRKILKFGLIPYIAIYSALSGHVAYDYFTRHQEWLRNNVKNELVIKNFHATLEDRVKQITFIGENHLYNEKESEFARNFIRQFELVMHEGGDKPKEESLSEKVYFLTLSIPVGIVSSFMSLGGGRSLANPNLEYFAHQYNIPVLKLEIETEGGIRYLTFQQKVKLFVAFTTAAGVGPLIYYDSKNIVTSADDINYEKSKSDSDYVGSLTHRDKRSLDMSIQLLKYLKTKGEFKILVVTGKNHLPLMLGYLGSKMELKPIN